MPMKDPVKKVIQFLVISLLAGRPGYVLSSPINFKKVTDDQLWLGTVFAAVVLGLQALLGLYALVRYWRNYRITKKGMPPWLVLVLVLVVTVFWTVVFYFYVTGEGAQYIG